MKRKFVEDLLKDLEIEESTKKRIVDAIMDENGNDINNEKAKTEVAKNDLKVKESLIEELNSKIKASNETDIEKIKKEQFDLGKAEGEKEFDNFKKQNALETALGTFKAKDVKLLQKLIDNEKIEYKNKDGKYVIKGLDEQIKEIKESHSYLFEDEEKEDKTYINLGGTHKENPKIDSDMEAVARAMGIDFEEKK